jgi:hypothetical protein
LSATGGIYDYEGNPAYLGTQTLTLLAELAEYYFNGLSASLILRKKITPTKFLRGHFSAVDELNAKIETRKIIRGTIKGNGS